MDMKEMFPAPVQEMLQVAWEKTLLDESILDYISDHSNDEGIATIIQRHIAEHTGVSPAIVSQRIARLVKNGYLHREGKRSCRLIKNDIRQNGQFASLIKYARHVFADVTLLSLPLAQQAERTGLTVLQVQTSHGYLGAYLPKVLDLD